MISFRLLSDSTVDEIETTHRAGNSSSFKLKVFFFPFKQGHKGEAEKREDIIFSALFLCRIDVSKN